MLILEKIYLTNFREALTPSDRTIYDFLDNRRRKNGSLNVLIKLLHNEEDCKPEKKYSKKYINEEIELIKKILDIDLKSVLIIKILDNLKSHHNDVGRGIIYDSSNFKFIENYRSSTALDVAKRLLTREIKQLPKQLGVFFSHHRSHVNFIYKQYHIPRLIFYLKKLLNNTKRMCELLESDKPNYGKIIQAMNSEKSIVNLINYYLSSIVRQVIIEMKLYNALMTLKQNVKKPRKSIFFVFGGMERRYNVLIRKLISHLKEQFKTRCIKIDSFMNLVRIGQYDIYFITCIGPSARYYPPYYYSPTADEICKFIKRSIGKRNVERVLLFGVCGSFKDKRGAVYLPQRFGSLFYNFEKRVTAKDILKIKKSFLNIDNCLTDIVKGRDADVFTCSTLFNESVVDLSDLEYQRIKKNLRNSGNAAQKRKKKLIRGIKRFKQEKILDFSRTIREKNIADGVEMESYVFAKNFGDRLGVYLEVSDNVIKSEDVSFRMNRFQQNVETNFMNILHSIID